MAPKAPLDLDAGNDRRYRVYVLRLKNGDLYVGSTGRSINQRLAQHRDPGHKKPARPVRAHGVDRLETDLCLRETFATRDEAERVERQLANKLRKERPGVRVHQG